jgi:ABC-type metal ion transport system substrate-binding protein
MFVKDRNTKVIINNDDSAYNNILAMRQTQKDSEALLKNLNQLELEVCEIRELFQKFMKDKNS